MKKISIEWRHYDKDGETCIRCGSTGKNLAEAVRELSSDMEILGMAVEVHETLLPAAEMAQSNLLLFNGVPIEEVLDDSRAGESECASCSCLTRSATDCRTLEVGGTTYEEIPRELIREAILKVAGSM